MSEQTTERTETGGFDRRAALKKAAAAGAVVWSAPVLLTSTANAQTACTLKCAPPTASLNFNVTGRKLSCAEIPGAPGSPGQVTRIFQVDAVTVQNPNSACPCGGSATVTLSQTTFTYVDEESNQGVRFVTIGTATVTVTCLDRQGRPVRTSCTVEVQARFSGSCQGDGNTRFQFGALTNCQTGC